MVNEEIINVSEIKSNTLKNELEKKLAKIEKEMSKIGMVSVLTHGWQTQRYAKASRKLDYLSMEKFDLIKKIDEL